MTRPSEPIASLERMLPQRGFTPGAVQIRIGHLLHATMIAGCVALGISAFAEIIEQIGRLR